MDIDYSGGMIVGAQATDLSIPEEFIKEHEEKYGYEPTFYDWGLSVGLEYMSEWYDADDEGKVYGFTIKYSWREDELDDLIKLVKQKMTEFKQLTGVDAKLIGTQDIY